MCQVCKAKQLLTAHTFEKPEHGGCAHSVTHSYSIPVFRPSAAQGGIVGYKVHCSNKHSFMTQRPKLLHLVVINSLGYVALDLSLSGMFRAQ